MITMRRAEEIASRYPMFYTQEHGGLRLFSYRYCDPTVFSEAPDAVELRGLVFSDTGEIVARPLPKFFNLHEPQCTVTESDTATTTLKLDGSLVIGFLHDDRVRFASKGSLKSWVVDRAHQLAGKAELSLIRDMKGRTVCFELLDPEHPVVINYDKPELVLIAIRDNRTGDITPPQRLQEIAEQYGVKVVNTVHCSLPVREIVADVRAYSDVEGVVGYTDDGRLFKQKAEWYIRVHSALFNADEEKLAHLYLSGTVDDLYGLLPVSTRQTVDAVIERVNACISALREALEGVDREQPRKELALWVLKNVPKPLQGAFFEVHSGRDPGESAVAAAKKLAERGIFLEVMERWRGCGTSE